MRVAIAGWQHETNTFSPIKTTLEHFTQADNWPALSIGDEIFERFNNMNIPISGFIAKAKQYNFELVPLMWCSAVPSGVVTAHAFNTLLQQLLEQLAHAGALDAIYLDLHGAMVSEEYQDAEGEILRAVRAQVGEDIPILVSLDLHANVSEHMLANVDTMIAFQTYPHIDMAATGAKLADCLACASRYKMRAQPFSFIAPVTAQCTLIEPAQMIYQQLQQLEREHAVILSFTQGFALADTRHTQPYLFGYGLDEVVLQHCMDELSQMINQSKSLFKSELYSPMAAIDKVRSQFADADKPIIFADTQDNPGCGGTGDSTGILFELVQQEVTQAIVATLCAPAVAAAAHAQGIGGMVELTLDNATSHTMQATVRALGDGDVIGEGPFYKGAHMQFGQVALLDVNGVELIVATANIQAADRAIFKHLDVDYTSKKIVVLKSSVHFRADFQQLAAEILLVKSPGLNTADLSELEYTQLAANMELL